MIELPYKYYEKLEKLSEVMGVPISTLIKIMVLDTIDGKTCYNIDKRKLRKSEKDGDVHRINLFITEERYKQITNICDELDSTIKAFILDCIDFQCEDLYIIEEATNKKYIKDSKLYHDDKNNRPKPESFLEPYLELKAQEYNVSQKNLMKFYVSKYLNQILDRREDEELKFNRDERVFVLDQDEEIK